MKAIFIPMYNYNLDEINKELKDCKCIVKEVMVEKGVILIVDNVTRKEKLEKINNSNSTK